MYPHRYSSNHPVENETQYPRYYNIHRRTCTNQRAPACTSIKVATISRKTRALTNPPLSNCNFVSFAAKGVVEEEEVGDGGERYDPMISSLRLSASTNFPLSLIEFHSIRFPIGNLPVFTYYFLCLPREFVTGRYSFRYHVTVSRAFAVRLPPTHPPYSARTSEWRK